ncbi:MAG: HDOD domain-containing protein [Desulfovermiculus sp.]
MPHISVNKLEPGMIAARELRSKNGRLVADKGVPLSREHIRALKIWGISKVHVQDGSNDQSTLEPESISKMDPETQNRAKRLIRPRFALNDLNHPAIREIFDLTKHNLAQALIDNPQLTPAPIKRTQTRVHGEILFGKQQPLSEVIGSQTLDFNSLGLQPMPDVILQLQEALTDPKCSAITMAEVVDLNSGLSNQLLNLFNSSFFGLPRKIDSIMEAVTILGANQFAMTVLAQTVRSMFKEIAPPSMNMKKFWRHSMACAVAARTLGKIKGGMNIERLFLAGLLHDIGRIILMDQFPELMRQARKNTEHGRKPLYVAEAETIGMSHAWAGGMLLAEWKFPLLLEQAVRYHHQPAHSLYHQEAAIVHTADVLVHAWAMEWENPECVPPLNHNSWETLHLEPAVLTSCIQQMEQFFAIGQTSRELPPHCDG